MLYAKRPESITHISGDCHIDLISAVDPEVVFEPALALLGYSVGPLEVTPPNSGRPKILKWPYNWAPAHPNQSRNNLAGIWTLLETLLSVPLKILKGPYMWLHLPHSNSLSVCQQFWGSRVPAEDIPICASKNLERDSSSTPQAFQSQSTSRPVGMRTRLQTLPSVLTGILKGPKHEPSLLTVVVSQQSWESRTAVGNIPGYKPDDSERVLYSTPSPPTAICE